MKYHPHGSVLFITLSLEEGILLLPNPLCRAIIEGCLARAQHLYPVTISHLIVEGTHVHFVAVVTNPDDIQAFIRHFKAETAHMLNRVLGRQKRTVWCEGYDSPIVLTPLRALVAICYLYANPAKDNLETSIDQYPGISTWKMYRTGNHSKEHRRVRRFHFQELCEKQHSLEGYTSEAERVLSKAKTSHIFSIDPNAWLRAFGIVDPSDQAQWNERIVRRVRVLEGRAHQKRAETRRSVIGRSALLRSILNTTYRSNRSGRKMWCLSENRDLRKRFIRSFKALQARGREVRKRWLQGDFRLPYPLGLYPPSFPKLAEPLSAW